MVTQLAPEATLIDDLGLHPTVLVRSPYGFGV